MENGRSRDEKKKRLSCGFSVADKKINLIDILSEDDDDDFLVASTFFDSIERSSSDVELMHKKEQNLWPCNDAQQSRPSFLRRSLAWDSAFFDSAGVLDPDELSFINKGFRETEAYLLPRNGDVRKRRSVSGSAPNADDFSVDWLEIGPSAYNPEARKMLNVANGNPESGLKQQASKRVNKSCRNKMKSNHISSGKNISIQSDGKMKKESTVRKRQGTVSSPKGIDKATYVSLRSRKKDNKSVKVDNESHLKMDKDCAKTGPGQGLVVEKKSTSQDLPSLSSASVSFPKYSSVVSLITASASSILKRKTERQNSSSTHLLSLLTPRPCPPAASSTSNWPSGSLSSAVGKQRSIKSNDVKEATDFPQYSSEATPKTCYVGSLPEKSIRPSGLRPPSPQIRFFNENTPPRYLGATRSNKMLPQRVLPEGTELFPDSSISSKHVSGCRKLKSPCSYMGKNIKRPTTELTNTHLVADKDVQLKTGKFSDYGKYSRNKLGLNCGLEEEKRRDILKNKNCSENHAPKDATGIPAKATDHLSRHFEAIDLKQEKVMQLHKNQTECHLLRNEIDSENHGVPAYSDLKQENQLLDSPMAPGNPSELFPPSVATTASMASTRTPLTDKTSTCNFNGTLALPMKSQKEQSVKNASSVCIIPQGSDKENR